MLFASFLWPIIDGLATLTLAWIEMLKGKISCKITQMNVEIKKTLEPEEPPRRMIGFQAPDPEDDEEYEEDEDD